MNLEDIFSGILKDYYNTCNVQPASVIISIVDDMGDAYAKLRPDHVEQNPELIEYQREFNGSVVPPKESDGVFTILLDKEFIITSSENGNDWVGTLVHEAVHVDDFIQFAKLVGATDYDFILDRKKYRMFHLWTEFHAKAIGYYFLRKYTFENVKDEKQVKFIMETELPYQINNMFEAYHSTNNGDQQMYYVVHFIGRIYVLQKLFPKYFTEKEIKPELFTKIGCTMLRSA